MRTLILLSILMLLAAPSSPASAPTIHPYPVMSLWRLELTRRYCLRHYGINDYRLLRPRMIVIHYTETDNLKWTLQYFKPAELRKGRYERAFGKVNVAPHYLVARDGRVFSLVPDHIVARHIIGFNHVAIGIENLALNATKLTRVQLEQNAALVAHLVRKYKTIKYLIGHHEFNKRHLPHFRLFREHNKKYDLANKPDPGPRFMRRLRRLLWKRYQIRLLK